MLAQPLLDQREVGQLGVQNVQQNAALQAYGYEVQATNETAQAGLLKEQAGYDVSAGFTNAAANLASSPSVESFVSGQFPTAPSGAGDQDFAPGATGAPTSLISGEPQVPSEYSWMQESGGLY